MELVPLKVKIGLKNEGGKKLHAFPDFNQISGHADDDIDSPKDNWDGIFCVPDNFAQAAVSMFPAQCSILTDTEAGDFYNDRGHIRDTEIKEDVTVLQSIKAKRDLSIPEDQADIDALNPDHPAFGRRRNKRKTWTGFKTAEGVTIQQ